jgi:hypothetical protein
LVLSPNKPPYPIDQNIQWYKNGNPITGSQNDTLTITSSGNYSVKLRHSVCSDYILYHDSVSCAFINCSTTPNEISFISLYPNPALDYVTIYTSRNYEGKTFNLTDLCGRTVLTGVLEKGYTAIEIDGIARGAYMFKINQPETRVIKFLKE